MYNVIIYNSTGFDAVNIPRSPAVIEAAATSALTLPAIDVVQNYFLTSVTVKTTFDAIKYADYCKVGDFYYFVTNIRMTSPDVAILTITPDGLTSALALGSLQAIDGMTERRRVTNSEDTMGAFTSDDALLAPQEPLKLVIGANLFAGASSTVSAPYVESLIDLKTLQDNFTDNNFTGRTFVDPTDSEAKVTVPAVNSLTGTTTVFRVGTYVLPSTKTELYKYTKVQEAIGLARALGVESAIISQKNLPTRYMDIIETDDGSVTTISGKVEEESTGLAVNYATVKNKRLLYGVYNRYGIMSASGASAEFNPEDIVSTLNGSPSVKMKVDPRPDGKPYFRYSSYLGDSSDDGFWRNCIDGLSWADTPLVYSGKSGSYMDEWNYKYSRNSSAISMNATSEIYQRNLKTNTIPSVVGASMGFIGSLLGAAPGDWSGIGQAGSKAVGAWTAAYNEATNFDATVQQYKNARNQELANFGFSQSVVSPVLSFPYNASVIRDMLGNGIVNYRYRYSDNDISRIDKLLTMYGYVDRRKFKIEMFDAHEDFEYLQLSGVSIIGSSLPRWWRDIIKVQLNTGFRMWHVKPSVIYYGG